ncbi:MAG: DUF899 family protein [Pseudomonadota bacterium]
MPDKTHDKQAWLAARMALMEQEKALLKQSDAVAGARREMPWLALDRDYEFESASGTVLLSELFGEHLQLIVQHVMFHPDWDQGCPICSFWADGFNPMIAHLNQRGVAFAAVSRAPLEKLQAYQQKMGWTFTWVSAANNSFNYDFHVSATDAEKAAGEMEYNYRPVPIYSEELHGTSVFTKDDDGDLFHTYSTYARGVEPFNAAYGLLDLVPNGRNEQDLPFPMAWVKRHTEY